MDNLSAEKRTTRALSLQSSRIRFTVKEVNRDMRSSKGILLSELCTFVFGNFIRNQTSAKLFS